LGKKRRRKKMTERRKRDVVMVQKKGDRPKGGRIKSVRGARNIVNQHQRGQQKKVNNPGKRKKRRGGN